MPRRVITLQMEIDVAEADHGHDDARALAHAIHDTGPQLLQEGCYTITTDEPAMEDWTIDINIEANVKARAHGAALRMYHSLDRLVQHAMADWNHQQKNSVQCQSFLTNDRTQEIVDDNKVFADNAHIVHREDAIPTRGNSDLV